MPSRTSRFAAAAVALAAVALLSSILPAAACEPSLVNCGLDHDETEATAVTTRQIALTVPLRSDNDGLSWQLYRRLLSPRYTMPAGPLVGITVREFTVPRAQAPQQTWIEGTIMLRALNDGEEGWFPISSATTSAESLEAGRAIGFPRYSAGGSFEAADGGGWTAQTTVAGEPSMRLAWSPLSDVVVGTAAVDLTTHKAPYIGVAPLHQPTNRTRQKITAKPPVPVFDPVGGAPANELKVANATALAPLRKGEVQLALDPDLNSLDAESATPLPDLAFGEGESLADLIAVEQTLPALFWETDALLITQTDDLDDGKQGDLPPLPDAPPVDATVLAPPAAVTTGFAPPRLVLPAGSTLDLRNEDDTTHDLTCDERDPVTRQPLCHSAYANKGETKPVEGVERLPRGDHLLRCSLHSQMELTLTLQ